MLSGYGGGGGEFFSLSGSATERYVDTPGVVFGSFGCAIMQPVFFVFSFISSTRWPDSTCPVKASSFKQDKGN